MTTRRLVWMMAFWCGIVVLLGCAPSASPTQASPEPTLSPTALPATPTLVPTRPSRDLESDEETMKEQKRPATEGESRGGRAAGPAADLVAQAIADLAGRLGIAADAIQVQSAEAVEWPDASLGCPEPGMMYAQVITPGYRIALEAGGQLYEYHSSLSRVVYCPR